jgi:hypothetical protein
MDAHQSSFSSFRDHANSGFAKAFNQYIFSEKYSLANAHISAADPRLQSDIECVQADTATNSVFNVSISYFNPSESFRIGTFFNGPPSKCEVVCRHPGLTVEIIIAD